MAKIGEGHFSAWMRQGLRELRAAFYPDSNVAQPPEYGLYGTKTPGEVAQDRRSESLDLSDEGKSSALDDRLREASKRDDRDIEPPGKDMDRS
jgi:hypothetical protein